MTIYDAIASDTVHHDSPFLIVLMDYHETRKIVDIFATLWRANIHNVNVLQNDLTVATFFPFQRHNCADINPVLINRFVDEEFINSTVNFFPDKVKDLRGCPINIATANDSVPYIFVEKLDNGSFNVHGRDIKLLNTLAGVLNFQFQFTYIGML